MYIPQKHKMVVTLHVYAQLAGGKKCKQNIEQHLSGRLK